MLELDMQMMTEAFAVKGSFVAAELIGNGHINDTYAVTCEESGDSRRYVLQRINQSVFPDPPALMDNFVRVTEHLQRKLEENGAQRQNPVRRTLELVRTRDGDAYTRDEQGNYWRAYHYVDGGVIHETALDTGVACQAARAFGAFQGSLDDLDGPPLNETIQRFHHTRSRFETLKQAIEEDDCNRAAAVRAEIDFALSREAMVDVLLDLRESGRISDRVTHNDAKINNVLMDDDTGEWLCVLDLDTVMPGLVLYDFGDLVRTAAITASEDERDLRKVELSMPMFEALARGYIEVARDSLSSTEKELLAFSGKLITFEIGIRFLSDYLAGDTYFRIHRPDHNLDRCRTQFRLIESIETHEEDMNRLVAGL